MLGVANFDSLVNQKCDTYRLPPAAAPIAPLQIRHYYNMFHPRSSVQQNWYIRCSIFGTEVLYALNVFDRMAKQIGLTIPPNVLARADKVIR